VGVCAGVGVGAGAGVLRSPLPSITSGAKQGVDRIGRPSAPMVGHVRDAGPGAHNSRERVASPADMDMDSAANDGETSASTGPRDHPAPCSCFSDVAWPPQTRVPPPSSSMGTPALQPNPGAPAFESSASPHRDHVPVEETRVPSPSPRELDEPPPQADDRTAPLDATPADEPSLQTLTSMGFASEAASQMLAATGHDLQAAISHLLNGTQPTENFQDTQPRQARATLAASALKKADPSDVRTLKRILQNIVEYPGDEKYTRLSLSSKRLRALFRDSPESRELLLAAGFEQHGDHLVLTRRDQGLIWLCSNLIS